MTVCLWRIIPGGLVQGHDANPADGTPNDRDAGRQALAGDTRRHSDRLRELLMRRLQSAGQGAQGGDADRPPASRLLSIAICEPVARQVQYFLDREIVIAHRRV